MNDTIEIRPERPTDYEAIGEVVSLAFGREGEARLVAELRKLPGFYPARSLIAVEGSAVVGHVLFTAVSIRRPEGTMLPALALAPLAVRPARQRTGIGSRLTIAGLAACRQRGDSVVIVVGHANYYPRFGFRAARARGLEVPFPVADASFMVCDLMPDTAASARDIAGMIEYPAPFLAV